MSKITANKMIKYCEALSKATRKKAIGMAKRRP
jgi:hypothetical protein